MAEPDPDHPDDSSADGGRITELLRAAAEGDRGALEEAVEQVYPELQRVAEARLWRRYGGRARAITLEPSALVNETLLKIIDVPRDFANRRHFYAFATTVMLRVLIDDERRHRAGKRGGSQIRVTLLDLHGEMDDGTPMLELSEALDQLGRLDERKAEVVRLKLFWGLEMAEIAETLGTSLATVERDWRFSRRWLGSRLRGEGEDPPGGVQTRTS